MPIHTFSPRLVSAIHISPSIAFRLSLPHTRLLLRRRRRLPPPLLLACCGEIVDRMTGRNSNGNSPASAMEQQTVTEKKFGGITPKKPLISRDHERAYFDSADWVLGKQSSSNSAQAAAVEALKPKLKRTPHHQLPPRNPTCTSS